MFAPYDYCQSLEVDIPVSRSGVITICYPYDRAVPGTVYRFLNCRELTRYIHIVGRCSGK